MAINNYHWASKKGDPKNGGRHEINVFTMLAIIDHKIIPDPPPSIRVGGTTRTFPIKIPILFHTIV